MKKRVMGVLVVLIAVLGTLTGVHGAHANAPETVYDMLYRYWNAVNVRDYTAAYSLWSANPYQTYDQFVAGFAKSVRIEPYLGYYQAITITPSAGVVPAVVVGYDTDQTSTYYICYSVQDLGGQNFQIVNAVSRLIATGTIPDTASITALLALGCNTFATNNVPLVARGITPATSMMISYYDRINARSFAAAYQYWLHPILGPKPNGAPPVDYRPAFAQFQAGYATTYFINSYWGTYRQTGAYAGHGYIDGQQPAVLVSQDIYGRFVTYSGCYIIGIPDATLQAEGIGYRAANGQMYGIVSGDFKVIQNNAPTSDIINAFVNNDCSGLNLGY